MIIPVSRIAKILITIIIIIVITVIVRMIRVEYPQSPMLAQNRTIASVVSIWFRARARFRA